MAVSFDCFAHIPFVRIKPAEKLELHPGHLQHLSFEEWVALEDPSFEFQENRYSRAAPLFFCRRFDLDEEAEPAALIEERVEPALNDELDRLAVALLLTLWNVFLPGPEGFARYISLSGSGGTWRRFGPNERELLFEDPSDSIQLGQDQFAKMHRILSRLRSINAGAATPELLHVVDALKVAARPGLTMEDTIVHFVSAQEDLLNTGGRAPMGRLAETFARRSALLYCDAFDSLGGFEKFFRELYAVRSGVLHGRVVADSIQQLEKMSRGIFRFFLFMCDRTCCYLGLLVSQNGNIVSGMSRLVQQIDSVDVGDRNAFQKLKESLEPDWLVGGDG